MDDEDEDELAVRQDGRLYPVGRALRATFHADNHDTLGKDVTGLMIDLSHVDAPAPTPLAAAGPRRSWWAAICNRLRRAT